MKAGSITFSTALDNKGLAKDIALTAKQIELVFDAAGKIFEAGAKYFNELAKSNDQYNQKVAELRGALATAFQPLYEEALPICLMILDVLTQIANAAAHVLSLIFGKTAKQSADNAKALNKEAAAIKGVGSAAKEAKTSLASFDQVNRLNDDQQAGGGGGANAGAKMDFSAFDDEEYEEKIHKITAIVSGALLALGAILTFSGANIPLGLALLAMGAVGLATEVSENWDLIAEMLHGETGLIFGIVSKAFLVLGAILTFTGANIPLGLGLMVAGAAGLAAEIAANWDFIVEAMQGPIGKIVGIGSALLLVLGIILLFTGVGTALGLGMIIAGGAGLATAVAFNWDFIVDKVQEVWENVTKWWAENVAPKFTLQYWTDKFSVIGDGIKAAIKNGINAAIGLMNQFINWVNEFLSFDIPAVDLGILGSFDGAHMQLVSIPNIPLLAQGAVIPPNAPFMAMLGDQRNGTNLEAPEDLIRQIVREEVGNNDQVVAMLAELIEVVRGVRVGDDTIGRMASRYIARTDRVLGR